MKNNTSLKITENKGSNILNKEQIAFNKLTAKIATLRKQIKNKKDIAEKLLSKFEELMQPLEQNISLKYIAIAHSLEKEIIIKGKVKGQIKNKIIEYILAVLDLAFIQTIPDAATKALHDKYQSESFDVMVKEQEEDERTEMAQFFSSNLNEKFDASEFEDTPEARKLLAEKLKRLEEKHEGSQNPFEENNTNTNQFNGRKKTKKQLEKEIENAAKQKTEADLEHKSVRGLYLELVKVLHPDTEMNEDEKLWKQELMKEVNDAYKNNNLLKILELEMNWLNRQGNYLSAMPIEKIKAFNNILRKQAAELETESCMIIHNPRYMDIEEFIGYNYTSSEKKLNNECKLVNNRIKDLEKTINYIENKKYKSNTDLLKFLEVTLDVVGDEDDFFNNFFDSLF